METQANKSPHTLYWIAGIAVTVFSAVGIAAILGWIPTSVGSPSESVAIPAQPSSTAKPAIISSDTASALSRERARERAREESRAQLANRATARANTRCAECGVVELVREIETKGEGSGIGAVGGAVVGGVLGHQVGGGRGQDVATVVGAVGGAVAGHQIEKHVKSTKSYEITVR